MGYCSVAVGPYDSDEAGAGTESYAPATGADVGCGTVLPSEMTDSVARRSAYAAGGGRAGESFHAK